MRNVLASRTEVQGLMAASRDINVAREVAAHLFIVWKDLFQADEFKGAGVSFEPQDDFRVLCRIRTPFGTGRAVIEFSLNAGEAVASITIQRQVFDRDDSVSWDPVFVILLPQNASPFVRLHDGRVTVIHIPDHDDEDDDYLQAMITIGLSICRAIAADKTPDY